MIGKAITGKGFAGCICYCLEDKKMDIDKNQSMMENRAEILLFNKCFGNKKELVQQFNEVRRLNPKQSKPVFHFTLSMAPGEHLSRPQLIQVAQDCAKEFGFADNQFLAVEHKDTQHQHIHIVANRIGYSGKTNVSDSNSYKRMAQFCRKMEQKYQLQQVLSPRRFLSKDQQLLPRNDQRKDQIKVQLRQILQSSKTMESFQQEVRKMGFEIIKGRGISFIDKAGVKIKGSAMGLSLSTIEKQLQKNQTQYLTRNLQEGIGPETRLANTWRLTVPFSPCKRNPQESTFISAFIQSIKQAVENTADLVADLYKVHYPSPEDYATSQIEREYYRNIRKKKKKRGYRL
ncbi:relaxase/mobilization nuclease domain-containing protein [Niabella sp.]|uniref:relaxase/mobilization nuclease domain-containing protein n=1 Tax=Niabella sp. TaxID=1962976 RepID=UPI0026235A92|nr:relaxase/mobilization nuclease domain-containing protein [Niabella sp.]